ncbi:MAG: thioredoxin [Ruminiclostridium sp.]|nr:thioredoxin [Ruminiclostridium sp.]
MSVISINANNFESEVCCSEVPVLVDFYAGWCTPCRMIYPILEDISDELIGSVKVVRVNVCEESELAGYYNILNVPTMMVFRDGKVTDRIIGATGKRQIMELLTT